MTTDHPSLSDPGVPSAGVALVSEPHHLVRDCDGTFSPLLVVMTGFPGTTTDTVAASATLRTNVSDVSGHGNDIFSSKSLNRRKESVCVVGSAIY